MKKIFSFLLLFVMLFTLAACGNGGDGNGNGNEENTATIVGASDKTINVGDAFDPMEGITANDTVDGDITSRINVEGTVVTSAAGTYTLTYTVEGSDGKVVTEKRTITVKVVHTTPPTEIVIMHGALEEVDPFDPAFSGREQQARQNKQREVEERLNVKVVYKEIGRASCRERV